MAGKMKKKLPIGIENFEKIREEDFYYIDKTGLIMELVDNWAEVNLFTRPRRFGKSLNMSMLKAFFEIGCKRELFDELEIRKETEVCEKYMGQEAMRFQFLLDSGKLTEREKKQYSQLIMVDETNQESFCMPDSVLMGSLKTLSLLLQKHYGKKAILLIDEYDVPLAKANEKGYYEQMVSLVRNVFEQALKTNDSLYFAVMTGCLRVAKGLTRREIEKLVAGEAVEKEIHEELTYNSLYDSADNMWSTLFATGYLTQRGRPEGGRFRLAIPNMEIRKIFTGQIMELFKERA